MSVPKAVEMAAALGSFIVVNKEMTLTTINLMTLRVTLTPNRTVP